MGIRCFLIEPIWGEPLPEPRGFKNGEEHKYTHEFGVGAMWRATWYPRNMTWNNETEPHLIVCCPNGPEATRDWDIDSRASNCGLPEDRLHRCWVRRGEPPNLTVDKAGVTCAAGAGSIALPNWHGFLRNGELTL